MEVKAIIQKKDNEVCLVFTESGGWEIPKINVVKADESNLKIIKMTGLQKVKIKEVHANVVLLSSDDDLQENSEILIGWFYKEDAIRSVDADDKKILEKFLG